MICIPQHLWEAGTGVVDVSSRRAMKNYGAIDRHLRQHKIDRRTLEGYAFRFKEVVVDLRQIKKGQLYPKVFELQRHDPLVQTLSELRKRFS